MDNKSINRYFRARNAFGHFLAGIAIAFIGWLLLHIICAICGSLVHSMWINWAQYVYELIACLLIIVCNIHSTMWYVAKYPLSIKCPKCGTINHLMRYREEYVLTRGHALYLETPLVIMIDLKIRLYMITLRPYLQLDCPTCHEQQVICPYCHEIIPKEYIRCTYNKPSKCPHCGKKIYTPMRREDNEKLIKITDL